MTTCPGCGGDLADPDAPCPVCDAGTQLTGPSAASAPDSPASFVSAPGSGGDAGDLQPGSLFANRYRIVGMLGRGGMGSVWRADDLKLGQSVALKFLPDAFRRDPDRVQRFLAEVRNAREVGHPNVCRVYDVGEEEGRLFLSMEYVDGEDLSKLLSRIGRLPQEKALDIARQLCAGLAALHDRGLLHRDLKPANVMLDGRGRVRLTDFGLAAVAATIDRGEIRSGTPQYMAPEQLAGDEVTERSDIYALGLLLYEVFTGHAAFAADTLEELQSLQTSAAPSRLSTHVQDVDPAVDRVIARCLDKDPAHRPASAIAVSTALPGGDPLAAALALGETPSPELVASAGGRGGLHPWIAAVLCAMALLGIGLYLEGGARRALTSYYDLDRPPAAYQERTRALLADIGYDEDPVDTAGGFGRHGAALQWIAETDSTADRWNALADRRPEGIGYWYRQSPTHLIPNDSTSPISLSDPPPTMAGMIEVTMEVSGRLISFEAVPPERLVDAPVDSMALERAWDRLFEAADLPRSEFRAVAPGWIPAVHAERRLAWRGSLPGDSTVVMTVEAGATGERATYFRVVGPWSRDTRTIGEVRSGNPSEASVVLIVLSVLAGVSTLAFRNIRRRRGDVARGAVLGLALIVAGMVRYAFSLHHVPLPDVMLDSFFENLAVATLFGVLCFVFYLAVEPFTRSVWPQTLIAWNRMLGGRWRDPMVGRSVLVGMASVALIGASGWLALLLQMRSDPLPPIPSSVDWRSLSSTSVLFGEFAMRIPNAFFNGLFFLALLALIRMAVRVHWIAYALFVVITTGVIAIQNSPLIVGITVGFVLSLTWIVLLVRFGLLAFIVNFYVQGTLNAFPMTLRFDQVHSGPSMLYLAVLLFTLVFGAVVASAGREGTGRDTG